MKNLLDYESEINYYESNPFAQKEDGLNYLQMEFRQSSFCIYNMELLENVGGTLERSNGSQLSLETLLLT